MEHRKQQHSRSPSSLPPQLATVTLHAAGLAVGAEAHYGAVPPTDEPQPVRCFGACTADLEAPLFELLETRGFDVLLVEPPQVHKLKGRPKSDVHGCQWWHRLHTFGLLAGAFRPADQVCGLRSSLRQRALLLT